VHYLFSLFYHCLWKKKEIAEKEFIEHETKEITIVY